MSSTASRPLNLCAAAALWTLGIVVSAGAPGCSSGRSSTSYDPQTESQRNPLEAQRLTQEAAAQTDPARAERLLRQALAADLYHGPAHNNLGVLYLRRSQLYEAAGEFEWAQRLLPGHPDPRMNLGLTMERAGRTDEALSTYTSALEVYPDHLPTLEAMTRLQVRSSRTDDRTRAMLHEIALRSQSDEWRRWARECLARLPN